MSETTEFIKEYVNARGGIGELEEQEKQALVEVSESTGKMVVIKSGGTSHRSSITGGFRLTPSMYIQSIRPRVAWTDNIAKAHLFSEDELKVFKKDVGRKMAMVGVAVEYVTMRK